MKKFIGNTALKILAVTFSFIVFFTMLISVVGSIIMLFSDFYTRDFATLEENIMEDLAREEMYNLVSLYDGSDSYVESYYKDKNVLYHIENTYSGETVSNFKGQDYIAAYSTSEFVTRFVNSLDGSFYDADAVNYDYENDYYYHYATNIQVYETSQKVEFTIYIPRNMQFTDRFFLVDKLINIGYENRYVFIFTAVISLALCIAIYSYLFISVGHRSNSADIKVAMFNNIPADILSVIVFFIFLYGIWLLTELYGLVITVALGSLILVALYFVVLWYLLSVAVQIKAKTIIKHTFLYWLFKKISKIGSVIKHIYKNFATVYKVAMIIGAFLAFELIFMGLNAYEADNLIICWIVISVIAAIILLLAAIAFQRVKQGGEKIVNGDLDNKIDTQYMFGDIKDFAESLNNINQGLQTAIDDKMKSERFKTELITNVSHDIKTPLTSIVNYVDLIKKENCENQKINDYIEVLDRQSIRLKKLIEDLVEASKASTGNLSVELARCNLSVLINQAVGEFSEKLEAKKLQVMQSLPTEETYILADGRRLWRVFDNLLNNICKYAMSGTRVYIDLVCDNSRAVITFRNISELPINVTADELTERFVRGDRSRNTEGSGLGLSIAKSLTELQNGSFEISTDGDLFKAKITFDTIE
ncbi:MAG: HAMP domain-containing histidine kinase [Clostridia bacterium]|nr:HAMP domain-containing histidine kinase [Clostridia bacterium]